MLKLAMIHMIAKTGNMKFLEIILGKNVDLEFMNKQKESALVHILIKNSLLQFVKKIIKS